MAVQLFVRSAFILQLDINGDGKTDAAEAQLAAIVFDHIALGKEGEHKETLTADDYFRFAADKKRVAAFATAIAPLDSNANLQNASSLLADVARFELNHLRAADPEHKLSSRAKTLDGFLDSVMHKAPVAEKTEFTSRLWAVLPKFYLDDSADSITRLRQHLQAYPKDANAQKLLDTLDR